MAPGQRPLGIPYNMAAHTAPFPDVPAGFEGTCVLLPLPDGGVGVSSTGMTVLYSCTHDLPWVRSDFPPV